MIAIITMNNTIKLSDEELELLLTSLRCLNENSYNMYTTRMASWDSIKEIKENLRLKIKSKLFELPF